jgi:hypothetical protein
MKAEQRRLGLKCASETFMTALTLHSVHKAFKDMIHSASQSHSSSQVDGESDDFELDRSFEKIDCVASYINDLNRSLAVNPRGTRASWTAEDLSEKRTL